MISLQIKSKPSILEGNEQPWGIEYESDLEACRTPKHRYRHDEVKAALRAETNGKCAYCESKIEHVAYSHIEHILAKSHEPQLVCTWENLTLACQICNTNKGDYFSHAAPLLNPYQDDVENEIVFYGPMAVDRSPKARLTLSKLRLNRPELLFRRNETLRNALRIIELLTISGDNQALLESLLDELREKMECSEEYSSCIKFFTQIECPERGITLTFENEAAPS